MMSCSASALNAKLVYLAMALLLCNNCSQSWCTYVLYLDLRKYGERVACSSLVPPS